MNAIEKRARELLERRRKNIQRVFAANEEEERQLQREVEPDWPDRALAREGLRVLEHLTDGERYELSEIDAALERIQSNLYGRCEKCEGPIGRQRLLALPETRHCIA